MRRVRGWAMAGVVCLASLAGLGAGGGAARADDVDGWWYLTNFGVEAAWAKGYDGSGVTIALIDSPVDLRVPWLQGANVETFDNPLCGARGDSSKPLPGTTTNPGDAFHATNTIGLYAGTGDDGKGGPAPKGVAPKARILLFPKGLNWGGVFEAYVPQWQCDVRAGTPDAELADLGLTRDEYTNDHTGAALSVQVNRAIDEGADIIHMPFGFSTIQPSSPLEKALLRAVREEVILVGGRANDTTTRLAQVSSRPSTIEYFPGGLTVSGIDRDHSISPGSATIDPGVDILAPSGDILNTTGGLEKMSVDWGGNSGASAIMTGYIALLMNKWPDATGNQILHAVLATTLDGKGTATRDPNDIRGWGSFVFSYTDTDPATYPDSNPIFDYDLTRIIDYTEGYTEANSGDKAGEGPLADWEIVQTLPPVGTPDTLEAWWPDVMALHRELDPDVSPSPSASTPTGQAEAPAASTGIPVWVWAVIAAILLAVAVAVTLVIVLTRRKKTLTPPAPAPGYRY